MNYYDKSTREELIVLLTGYRKLLEQSRIAAQDQSYNILVTDRIKRIDEMIKTVKPSAFDFLTERKIEKLQSEKYLQQQLETAKVKMKEQLRTEITDELKKECEEKKQKTDIQPEEHTSMPLRQARQSSDNKGIDIVDEPEPEEPSTDIDDDIPDMQPETIE